MYIITIIFMSWVLRIDVEAVEEEGELVPALLSLYIN